MNRSKNIKFIILMLVISLTGIHVSAQQFPLYSQYYQNRYILNPGVAGSIKDFTPVRLSIHKQWLNVNESPSTQYLTAHQKLRNEHVGIGGMIFHDSFGPIRNLGMNFTYAYHLELDRDLHLGLGLTAMLMQYRLSLEQEDFYGFEPILTNERLRIIVPDAHFGAYLYHDEDFWAGFSITQLFQTHMKLTGTWQEKSNQLVRHYHLMAGYNINFPYSQNFELVPSVLVKTTEVTKPQLDINLKMVFYEDFWMGMGLRHDDSFVAMIGLTFDQYYFAFSHDFTFTDISRVTNGSEELSFGWNIQDGRIGQRSFFE
ncbi:MAG: type IX secretion system membrane protein PorP/SprF [Bacteroidales bacterium]